jgi:hypothetical protein
MISLLLALSAILIQGPFLYSQSKFKFLDATKDRLNRAGPYVFPFLFTPCVLFLYVRGDLLGLVGLFVAVLLMLLASCRDLKLIGRLHQRKGELLIPETSARARGKELLEILGFIVVVFLLLIGLGIFWQKKNSKTTTLGSTYPIIAWGPNSIDKCNSQVQFATVSTMSNNKEQCKGLILVIDPPSLQYDVSYLETGNNSKQFSAVILDDYDSNYIIESTYYQNLSKCIQVIPVLSLQPYNLTGVWYRDFWIASNYSSTIILPIAPDVATFSQTSTLYHHFKKIIILVYESQTSWFTPSQSYINSTIEQAKNYQGLVVWNGIQF